MRRHLRWHGKVITTVVLTVAADHHLHDFALDAIYKHFMHIKYEDICDDMVR
jgi:hypothetical protein